MYYVVKTKNNVPFILGQFEDINKAIDAVGEEGCIAVGDVNEYIETVDEAMSLIQNLTSALMQERAKNRVLKEILFDIGYGG